jgi:hypothetical protein
VIRLVVTMRIRYLLSLRQVEAIVLLRGIDIRQGTVRFWRGRCGPMFAAAIGRPRAETLRAVPQWRWHLDEVLVKDTGETHCLWRAVDPEGEILEGFATKPADRKAVPRVLTPAMSPYGRPHVIVSDRLASYGAAVKGIAICGRGLGCPSRLWSRSMMGLFDGRAGVPSRSLINSHSTVPGSAAINRAKGNQHDRSRAKAPGGASLGREPHRSGEADGHAPQRQHGSLGSARRLMSGFIPNPSRVGLDPQPVVTAFPCRDCMANIAATVQLTDVRIA